MGYTRREGRLPPLWLGVGWRMRRVTQSIPRGKSSSLSCGFDACQPSGVEEITPPSTREASCLARNLDCWVGVRSRGGGGGVYSKSYAHEARFMRRRSLIIVLHAQGGNELPLLLPDSASSWRSGNWRGKHSSLSRAAGADQLQTSRGTPSPRKRLMTTHPQDA